MAEYVQETSVKCNYSEVHNKWPDTYSTNTRFLRRDWRDSKPLVSWKVLYKVTSKALRPHFAEYNSDASSNRTSSRETINGLSGFVGRILYKDRACMTQVFLEGNTIVRVLSL